jgi:hypothetical protein
MKRVLREPGQPRTGNKHELVHLLKRIKEKTQNAECLDALMVKKSGIVKILPVFRWSNGMVGQNANAPAGNHHAMVYTVFIHISLRKLLGTFAFLKV